MSVRKLFIVFAIILCIGFIVKPFELPDSKFTRKSPQVTAVSKIVPGLPDRTALGAMGSTRVGFQEVISENSRPFNFSFPPPMSDSEHYDVIKKSHISIVNQLRDMLEARIPQSKGDTRRPAAIFTIVRNEPVFVRAWVAHYRHTFLDSDMYILDNNMGRDGSLEEFSGKQQSNNEILNDFLQQGNASPTGSINIVNAECDAYYNDHNCLRGSVSLTAAMLLLGYKTVVFSEVDELLFSVLPNVSLWQYLCKFNKEATKVSTRTPIETRTTDTSILAEANATMNFSLTSTSLPFSWNASLRGGGQLATQRDLWFVDSMYEKPLIFQRPMRWRNGFHSAKFGPPIRFDETGRPIVEIDFLKQSKKKKKKYDEVTEKTNEIMLLHIHRIDKSYFTYRGSWKSSQTQRDSISPQARYSGSRLEAYYWGDFNEYAQAVPIPSWWREVEERHMSSRPTGICKLN